VASILDHIPPIISNEDKSSLNQLVSEVDIFAAVWSLGLDKSPRPDDFSFSFYRHFWELIKYDLIYMF
jgi:hypothetical protein